MNYTYNDFKQRVSIIEVAIKLGYKFDKSKGASRPNFVKRDTLGRETDRIIITNPENKSQQGFWRRSAQGTNKGDLISFVKENLKNFTMAAGSRNEVDAINKVLSDFANVTMDVNYHNYLDTNGIHRSKPFDLSRYDREMGTTNVDNLMAIFNTRNITRLTVEKFAPYIERVSDKENRYHIKNIAFPYRVPGSDVIEGYEFRGFKGFKGKAEGSNSSTALWVVDFSGKNPTNVENVYFTESAYDAMAFYQANKTRIDIEKSAFVSTGGSFSDGQLLSTMKYYQNAKAIDCFDNDLEGNLYGCRMVALLSGAQMKTSIQGDDIKLQIKEKEFLININDIKLQTFRNASGLRTNKVGIFKAPNEYKDWNDVIMGERKDSLQNESKIQHLEKLEEKRHKITR